MFRVRRSRIDTLSEHVIFIHREAVATGDLGFKPLDRVLISGVHPGTGASRQVAGVLNFCGDYLLARDEIGLSEVAFSDLGLPEGALVSAAITPAPSSVDLVRGKLRGQRLSGPDFLAILTDVVARRYSKVELSMFVLGCALRTLDAVETTDLTRAMIATGSRLEVGPAPVAGKHSVGGVPGNRTSMVAVPILAALGLRVPKTSSRAITSPAGTADTMGVLAQVALPPDRLYRVIERAGACIAWGGALGLAPADDVLITVERPMEIDTEPQMVASILAKQKTAGVTHALIDIPAGPSAKVQSVLAAESIARLFREVAREIDLEVDTVITEARGPIGRGIGPRLEALDVLAVLRREPDAPVDLREKSLDLAARVLEMTNVVPPMTGYRTAAQALDSGAAEQAFERIVDAQGRRELPPPTRYCRTVPAPADGRIREIDCWEIARVAKHAGAPANPSAGVRLLHGVGEVVERGEPLVEIHAQTDAQLEAATEHAGRPTLLAFGF